MLLVVSKQEREEIMKWIYYLKKEVELRSIKLLVISSGVEASLMNNNWFPTAVAPPLLPIIALLGKLINKFDALKFVETPVNILLVKFLTSFITFLRQSVIVSREIFKFVSHPKFPLKSTHLLSSHLYEIREWVRERELITTKFWRMSKRKEREREVKKASKSKKTSLFLYIFGRSLIYFAYQKCLFTLFMFFSFFFTLSRADAFEEKKNVNIKINMILLLWIIFLSQVGDDSTFMKIDKFFSPSPMEFELFNLLTITYMWVYFWVFINGESKK
jgi:hypothetical protein